MKKNTLTKKLTAGLLTGVMVLSMGTTAFAEPTDPAGTGEGDGTTVETPAVPTITKTINKPREVVLPNVTYNFTLAYTRETTGVREELIDSEKTGVALEKSKIQKLGTDGNGIGDSTYTYKDTIKVIVDEADFDTPGTYVYTITETAPTPAYEGLDIDDSLEFTVVYGYAEVTDGEGHVIGYEDEASILFQGFADNEGNKSYGIFEDDYGVNEQDGKLNNLSLTKELFGNQADPTKDFEFTITITPGESNVNKQYSILEPSKDSPEPFDATKTIRLKGGQTATIYGLSATDKYVINETDYSNNEGGTHEGYETSWVIATSEGEELKSMGSHNVSTGDQTVEASDTLKTEAVTFTNHKNNSTPTGIAMTFAPYAVMVAFAGVFAVMFLRKKREDF